MWQLFSSRLGGFFFVYRKAMDRQPIDSDHFRKLASIELETDEQIAEYVSAVLNGELIHADQPEPTHELLRSS
jgi:hypothetical protein